MARVLSGGIHFHDYQTNLPEVEEFHKMFSPETNRYGFMDILFHYFDKFILTIFLKESRSLLYDRFKLLNACMPYFLQGE